MTMAHRLHRDLEQRLGVVDLVVTDNRRRMLTTRCRDNRREIRLHHMFLGCGVGVVEAIAGLASGEDKGAREQLQAYVSENRSQIRFEPSADELNWKGEHFDLKRLLNRVRRHFDGREADELEDIAITWGRDGRGSKSIRFGSFDFDQRLIRVHPALDASWVPRYFIEFIVYHELLHAVCPPAERDASRCVHTEEFLQRERDFPRYREAMEWEAENLERFLNRE